MPEMIPELPEEIRAARIGTCFDPVRRKLMTGVMAIDMERINAKHMQFVSGTGKLQLRASGSTRQNAYEDIFGFSAKTTFGSWGSLGYSMSLATSEVNNSGDINCYCSHVYSGQHLTLNKLSPNDLFNCMTDEFQHMLLELVQSETAKAFFKHYLAFTKRFGFGMVTRLDLTSGSAFRMTARFADQTASQQSKYGGELAATTPWAGAAVATEFSKKVVNFRSDASMDLDAAYVPEDTPTMEWCSGMLATVSELGFAKLAETTPPFSPTTPDTPAAPSMPEGKPTGEKIPDKPAPDIDDDLKKELMNSDGFKGTWKDYIAEQERLLKELEAKKVVAEKTNPLLNTDWLKTLIRRNDTPGIDAASGMDLGGYMPCNYVITPWDELFPAIAQFSFRTLNSMYMAKILVYYLTRLQFSNYLFFLSDIGAELTKNEWISHDAQAYLAMCNEFLEKILAVFEESFETVNARNGVSETTGGRFAYESLVQHFEETVRKNGAFHNKEVYSSFFGKYAFFADAFNGYIGVTKVGNEWRILTRNGKIAKGKEPLIPLFIEQGVRLFPLPPKKGGEIDLVLFDDRSWKKSQQTFNMNDMKKDEYGVYYPIRESSLATRFYTIPNHLLHPGKGGDLKVTTLPMVHAFDFDELVRFASFRSDGRVL